MELKKCPFCGSSAHFGGDSDGEVRYGIYVACDECFCAVGEGYDRYAMPDHVFPDEESAARAWNNRSE